MHSPCPDKQFSGNGRSGFFRACPSADSVKDATDIRVGSDSAPTCLLQNPAQVGRACLGDMAVSDTISRLKSSGSQTAVTSQLFRIGKPGQSAGFHQNSGGSQDSDARSGTESVNIPLNLGQGFNFKRKITVGLSQLSFQKKQLVSEVKPPLGIHSVETIAVGVKVGDGSGAGKGPGSRQIGTQTNPFHAGLGSGGASCQVMAVPELLTERIKRLSQNKTYGNLTTPQHLTDKTGVLKVGFDISISHGMKSGGISQIKKIHLWFQQKPQPAIKTDCFKSYTDGFGPLFNKLKNLITTFGRDSSNANFFSVAVSNTPCKRIFMQVNSDKSLFVFHRWFSLRKVGLLEPIAEIAQVKAIQRFWFYLSGRLVNFLTDGQVGLFPVPSLFRNLTLEVSYVS